MPADFPTTPPDVAAAIMCSDYRGEAADRLAVARGIRFGEALALVDRWAEDACDAE